MREKNLLIICNSFPNEDNTFIGEIFVKEQVKYLKCYFNNIYVVSPIAYGMDYLRKTKQLNYQFDNVKVFFPKYINNPFFWYYARSIWIYLETMAIKSLIKKEHLHFDLIHAHFTWPSGAVAVNLKKQFNVPVIITEGSSTTLYNALASRNPFFIDTYRQADAIIRNNKKDIPLFVKCGIDGNKIFYVEYGYDKNKFSPFPKDKARKLIGIDLQRKVILNIGRLSNEKGHKNLIGAMRWVVNKNPDTICYIGGSGPLSNQLQKQIIKSNLEKNVKLIGFVPDKSLSLWMNAADLFVLPSLTEGNPTVMLECLGCGQPFVGTKVGGVPEVINSNHYGLLVEPDNQKELADKIIQGLEREWNREEILLYADQYSTETIAEKIITIYNYYLFERISIPLSRP